MNRRTERGILAAILLLALALRLGYVLSLRENPYFDAPILDPAYHVEWARSLAAGAVFEEGPYFRAPLYPYLLGAVFRLFGDGLLLPRLLQILLGLSTVLLTWGVGREAFSPRVGLLAAGLVATSWVLIYFDAELLLPTLATPLYLGALLATLKLRERPTPGRVLLAGLVWGLGTITRPNVLLLAPVLALWLLRRSSLKAASILALGWCLPVLPVTTYNALVGKELVLVSTQAGVNLWIGNHPGADGHTAHVPGTTGTDFRATHLEARALAEGEAGRGLTHAEVSRHYAGKAWSFLLGTPGASIPLLARKLGLFWQDGELGNNQPVLGTVAHHAPWLPWVSLPFWLLAPLGLAGLVLALGRRDLLPLTGFALVFCLSVVLFFVCSRFRAPLLPCWSVLAAHAVVWAWDNRGGRAGRGPLVLLASTAAGAVLLLATGSDRALDRARGLSHIATGHGLRGEHDRAGDLHRAALSLAPDQLELRLAHADHLEATGDRLAAIREVRAVLKAHQGHVATWEKLLGLLNRVQRYPVLLGEADRFLAASPGHSGGHYYRGAALTGLERPLEAILEFERAVELDPSGSRAAFVLGSLYLSANREADALRALERAVENDHFPGARTQRIQAHLSLARLLAEEGDQEGARRVALLLAQRETGAPEARALLVEVGGSGD